MKYYERKKEKKTMQCKQFNDIMVLQIKYMDVKHQINKKMYSWVNEPYWTVLIQYISYGYCT